MNSWRKLLVHIITFVYWGVWSQHTYSKHVSFSSLGTPSIGASVRCPPAEELRHSPSRFDDEWNISRGLFHFSLHTPHVCTAMLDWLHCRGRVIESLYTVPFERVPPFLDLSGKFLRSWLEKEERKSEWLGISNPTMNPQTSVSGQA